MSSLQREPQDRFTSDKAQALASIKRQIQIVTQYFHVLQKIDERGKMKNAVLNFQRIVRSGEELTPPQVGYLEGIYERTMAALSGQRDLRVPVHHDRRKTIRYDQIK